MIERVARATFECRPYGDEHSERGIPSWETLNEDWREVHRKLARAAIDAMRDIPQGVVDAGNSALSSNGVDNVEDDDAALCWQAMIEFALSQDTHPLPSEDR